LADTKVTRSRKRRKRPAFPEVKGKIIEGVEIDASDNGCTIGILFQDRTYISFDVEAALTIMPELSDWKTENYKPLKRWPIVRS
jgi:hypothetical protein